MIGNLRLALVSLVVGLVLGLGVGYSFYRRVQPVVPDQAHPQIILPGGGVVAEEKPSAAPLPIPKGQSRTTEVVRTVYVTVQPDPPALEDGYGSNMVEKPVKIALSLERQADDSLRAVVTAEGGKILSALDIPLQTKTLRVVGPPPVALRWAVGGVYGTTAYGDDAKGVFIDRDFSFARTGVEVTRNSYAVAARTGWEIRAKLGIRF